MMSILVALFMFMMAKVDKVEERIAMLESLLKQLIEENHHGL